MAKDIIRPMLTIAVLLLILNLLIWIVPEFITGLDFENTEKFITSIVSLAGTLWAYSRFISSKIVRSSSKSIKEFLANSDNPMKRISKHFSKLIQSINKNVVVYIDDLDRCKSDYVVKLLEGIQTLFKNESVLYIVAADRDWIVNCFELEYKDYQETVTEEGQKLGELFLQKVFQLTTRVPNISQHKLQEYWNYLLTDKILSEDKNEQKIVELKTKFKKAVTERQIMNLLKESPNIPQATQFAVEQLSEEKTNEGIEHALQKYYIFLEPNPRSMKRLVNYYKVFRSVTIAEGSIIEEGVLVRWLILTMRWPVLTDYLKKKPYAINFFISGKPIQNEKEKNLLKDFLDNEEIIKIIKSSHEMGQVITPDIIKQCIGVY